MAFAALFSIASLPVCMAQVYQNVTLPSATPVVLEVASAFSSDDITEGSLVKLTVKYAVIVEGAYVVRTRAVATGKVLKIKMGSFNYPTLVTIEALNVQTVDEKMIALNGEATFKSAFNGEAATVQIGQILQAAVTNNVSVRGVQ